MRLGRVTLNGFDTASLIVCPNLVAAVAVECLASEHVAADTVRTRLDAR